jgi:hypothetical protein
MEHRWGFRQSSDLLVRLLAGQTVVGTGRLLNVSVGGAFLETTAPLGKSSVIELEPVGVQRGSPANRPVGAAVVRRTSKGVGVEWAFAGHEVFNVAALLAVLAGHGRRDTGARTAAAGRPRAAAPH